MSPRKHQGFAGQLAHPLSLDFLLQSFQIDQIDRNWMVLQSLAGPWSHPPFYVLFGLLPHPPFGILFGLLPHPPYPFFLFGGSPQQLLYLAGPLPHPPFQNFPNHEKLHDHPFFPKTALLQGFHSEMTLFLSLEVLVSTVGFHFGRHAIGVQVARASSPSASAIPVHAVVLHTAVHNQEVSHEETQVT